MEIDYAMGFITFLVFSIIALSMFINSFSLGNLQGLDVAADTIKENVMEYLETDVYQIPARFNSSGAASDKPLYFNMTWNFGMNSTRVYNEGNQVDCIIDGNAIHWQADLHDGWNDFIVKLANNTEPLNCTGVFSTANENQTIVWAQEKEKMILQSNIDSMISTSLTDFKSQLGIDRHIRIEINSTSGLTTYGEILPARSSVYTRMSKADVFENDTAAEVWLWIW